MATELATAYVSILPSMQGFKQQLAAGLGVGMNSTAAGAGKKIGGVLFGALAGVGMSIMDKAIGTVASSLGGAISRVDTLNAFPKVMKNLGYSALDAKNALDLMGKSLVGLPTSLDAMAGAVQVLAPLTSSLDEATRISLALNNALIAGGKSTVEQENALQQYVQMLSVGKVDMQAWRSMVSAMPGQLNQLAQALLGAGANQMDLYNAMQTGQVTFDDFNQALLELNENGLAGFASFQQQAKDATGGIATSFTNLKTAVTRGLAKIIDPFAPAINNLATGLSGAISKIADFITPVSVKIAEFLNGLGDNQQLAQFFAPLLETAAQVAPLIGEAFASFSSGAIIIKTLTPLLPELAAGYQTVAQQVLQMLPPIIELGTKIADAIIPALTQIIAQILPPLIQVTTAIAPLITQIIQALLPLADIILPQLGTALTGIGNIIGAVFQTAANIIDATVQQISGIIQIFTSLLKGDWEGVWQGMQTYLDGSLKSIQAILQGALNILAAAIGTVLNNIKTQWDTFWNTIKNSPIGDLAASGRALIDSFVKGITQALANAKKIVAQGLGAIRRLFPFSPAKEGPFSGKGWVSHSGISLGETFTQSIAHSLKTGKNTITNQLAGIEKNFAAITTPQLETTLTSTYTPGTLTNTTADTENTGSARWVLNVHNPVVRDFYAESWQQAIEQEAGAF